MDEVTIKRRLLFLVAFIAIAVFAWYPELSSLFSNQSCDKKALCVVFLNVGQGDAIFIQSPQGVQMLIDAGRPDGAVLRELAKVMSFSDRDLDYVLATHPDSDHIGGLKEVFSRYEIKSVIRTENESDTDIWQAVEETMTLEGSSINFARRGQVYDLGGEVKLEILFPDTDPSKMESNTASIVARLIYGETSFLLTGDSPKAIEEYLVLIEGENLHSNVLKAGHHGSRTSTSELFLDEVSPDFAVISAGKDNSYGHPHMEVTDMLFNKGIKTLNTALVGKIVFWSDGKELRLR